MVNTVSSCKFTIMAAPKGNKYAIGNNGGRPPLFSAIEEVQEKIDGYFTWIQGEFHMEEREEGKGKAKKKVQVKVWDRQPESPTITGLALFLGFDSKQSLYDYKKKEEFSYPIKRALMVIENNYENALFSQAPSGAIFALKNMDWSDKKEVEHSGGVEVKQITGMVIK